MFNLSSSGLWRLSGWLLLGSDHWRRADCATHRWLHRHHSQKGNMPWPISLLTCNKSREAWRLIFNFTYIWTHKTSLTLRKACSQATDHILTHKTRQLLGIRAHRFLHKLTQYQINTKSWYKGKKILTGFNKIIHVWCIKSLKYVQTFLWLFILCMQKVYTFS